MKKPYKISKLIVSLTLTLPLIACSNGGGGSSSPAPGPGPAPGPATVGNYYILTPSSGVSVSTISAVNSTSAQAGDPERYTKFGTNGSTLYAGTSAGKVLKLNSNNSSWTQVATAPNNLPIIAIAGNSSNGVYYAPYPSNTAYATTGSGFTNGLDIGNITTITSSSNGSTYFGTDLGNVGLTNNPASKTIDTLPNPLYGPIISIGCTSGSCNSGQQGVLVLQAASNSIPPFDSSVYKSTPEQYKYPTQMYYLQNQGHWVLAGYNNILSTGNTVTVDGTAYQNVPEFVTSVTINPSTSKVYAGTNLFNVYSSSLQCNPGQGCIINWSNTPINTVPLSTVTNGTQGITSIAVLPNGSLYVVGNYSQTTMGLYQSQSTNN